MPLAARALDGDPAAEQAWAAQRTAAATGGRSGTEDDRCPFCGKGPEQVNAIAGGDGFRICRERSTCARTSASGRRGPPVAGADVRGVAGRGMTDAGYSGTPLAKKLGMRPGSRVVFPGAPAGFADGLDGVDVRARLRHPL